VSLRQFTVRACFTASCVCALAAPGSAAAQTGVHVDPGSPAGQEYAVPLDAARGGVDSDKPKAQTNQGTTNAAPATPSSPSPAPPATFGAGVTPAQPKPKPKPKPKARSHVPKPDVTRPVKVTAAPRLPDVDADSTVSPTAVTGGVVAAVLLLAFAVAAATRRTRRTSSP
jgi:hypothetical protein